jgi:hypothetical protein
MVPLQSFAVQALEIFRAYVKSGDEELDDKTIVCT